MTLPFQARDVLKALLLSLLILFGAVFLASYLNLNLFLNPHPALKQSLEILLMQFSILFPVLILVWSKKRQGIQMTWNDFGFRSYPIGKAFLIAVFAYLAFVLFYIYILGPLIDPFFYGTDAGEHKSIDFGIGFLPYLLLMIFTLFLAPFIEEFYFRGFLYSGLAQSWPRVLASLFSASFFALSHPDLSRFVHLLVFAMLLNFILEKTKSLWPGILLHLLYNCVILAVMRFELLS